MEVNKIKKSHEKSFFEWCEVKSPFFREAIQMHTSVRGEGCAVLQVMVFGEPNSPRAIIEFVKCEDYKQSVSDFDTEKNGDLEKLIGIKLQELSKIILAYKDSAEKSVSGSDTQN